MARFSFDTSAFIGPYRHYHPPDVFPSLWKLLAKKIDAGEIVASEEVHTEIEVKDDELLAFVNGFDNLFVPLDAVQQTAVKEIMSKFPRWVDVNRTKNVADPYVIALAKVENLVVVSYERGGGPRNPKIPYICREMGVEHMSFLDFLRCVGYTA